MHKSYYSNMFRELGIFNGIRFSVFNKVRHKISMKRNPLWRVHIRSMDYSLFIRPFTTDYDLIAEFFLNGAVNEERMFQYDIDLSDKIKGPVKYIIDAGANIGLFSVLYGRKYREASIIAVEPERENYQMLLKNTENLKNVQPLRGGIWSRDCYLKVNESKTGAWGFTVSECDKNRSDIRAYSIQNIMEKSGFPYIDILKMDIEGSEYEVFSSKKCLEWLQLVKVLIIETHDSKIPGCGEAVRKKMQLLGYVQETAGEDIVFYKP